MTEASEKQVGFIYKLHDRIKARDGSDLEFYRILEETTGKKRTDNLEKWEASKVIDALLAELEG